MQHWKNVLIRPDSTLREALEIINREALRVALVIDDNNYLLGVITDGDIRRGLLNNLALSAKAELVMNTQPVTAASNVSSAELNSMMKAKGILSIPILDDGKVVGLETFQSVNDKKKYPNPVFIMAGGFGTRLKPLTDTCPKPMLCIGGKPILETVIRSFVKAGFNNFYISTHYMPEIIKEHFGDGERFDSKINYVYEENPLGTGGALGLLPEDLSNEHP